MKYAIITNSENGDGIQVDIVDRDTLLDRITPDDNGDSYYGKKTILTDLPKRIDEYFTTEQMVVLEVKVPNIVAREVVTKYSIEESKK